MTNQQWIQNADVDSLAKFIRQSMFTPCCDLCAYCRTCYKKGIEEDFCLLGTKLWLEEEHIENEKY